MSDTLSNIIFYAVQWGLLTVSLLIPLIILLKLQKLETHFFPLLIAASLASAAEFIPYAGHFVAVVVLFFIIPRVSNAAASDVTFTISISYALAFCFDLFLLASLMGRLGWGEDPAEWKADREMEQEVVAAVVTNSPSTSKKSEAQKTEPKKEGDRTTAKKTAPANAEKATTSAKDKEEKGGFFSSLFGKKKEEQASPDKSKDRSDRLSKQIISKFSLKGIMKTTKASSVMIHTGVDTYTIELGASKEMNTTGGSVVVQCSDIGDNVAVLAIGGEEFELWLP